MKRIERLRKEALEACEWRGHKMSRFKPGEFWKNVRTAHCTNPGCQGEVWVDPNPPANGIDIHGDAVALNCPIPFDEAKTA